MITSDADAWIKYPHLRNWFNKLWVAQQLKYISGPGAVPVPRNGYYIVRPVMNLHGMGAGAEIKFLTTNDIDSVPPGFFWCEVFTGAQLTFELKWLKGRWNTTSCFMAERSTASLYRFDRWVRANVEFSPPKILDELCGCSNINVETIGGKIIEVHLRGSPDPIQHQEIIPHWSDMPESVVQQLTDSHQYIPNPDYVYWTDIKRFGFFCR